MKAESNKMVKKEVSFMKKKGAPKSMVKHEMGEMAGMKKGGMKKMSMGGYKDGGMPMGDDGRPTFVGDGTGKMKHGGMTMKKMASGGMTSMGKVKTGSGRDGVAERGKTKGTMIKMNKGGRAC